MSATADRPAVIRYRDGKWLLFMYSPAAGRELFMREGTIPQLKAWAKYRGATARVG